jgi:anti-sigma-K factor RskA
MTHEELLGSAAAYALGALDGDELARFEAHLPSCAECLAEVDAYRQVVALLAYAAPQAAPASGAALRQRILRQASAVRPISSARNQARPASRGPWLAVAASLALAFFAGLQYSRATTALSQAQQELAAARRDAAGSDSLISAFLGPEVHVVSLSQGEQKPAARVYWNHTRNIFIVTAFDVPPAPEGRTYQLWAIAKDKAPVSMGTFNTDATGRATAILPVATSITEAGFIDLCGLTLEPAGGSPQPTETPRLIGSWRHTD